jgi:hypothetical protein
MTIPDLMKVQADNKRWQEYFPVVEEVAEALGELQRRKEQLTMLNESANFAANEIKDPIAAYRLFRKLEALAPSDEDCRADLAESALFAGHPQETLRLAPALMQSAREPNIRLVMAHLLWLTHLLQQDQRAIPACHDLLRIYKAVRLTRVDWIFAATRTFLQRHDSPNAKLALRSLELFNAPFSCALYRTQAELCGITLLPDDPCAAATTQPATRPASQPTTQPATRPASQPATQPTTRLVGQ